MLGFNNTRFRLAGLVLKLWPFPRGRQRIANLVVGDESNWPATADVRFRFGSFVDVSIKPWPSGFRGLWCDGVQDDLDTKAWLSLLHPGDTVVDGGANMGYWTLVASHAVGPRGRVLAVEPVPLTAAALRRNLAASSVRNVTVVEAALSDRNGQTKMHLYDSDPFLGLSSEGCMKDTPLKGVVSVTARTPGDVIGQQRPVLVKLDVEGGELPALRGMEEILEGDTAPILTVEWNETTAAAMGYHAGDAVSFLEKKGYSCYWLRERGFEPFVAPRDHTLTPMFWAIRRRLHAGRCMRAGLLHGQ